MGFELTRPEGLQPRIDSLSFGRYLWLRLLLAFKYRFVSRGQWVMSPTDEFLHPSLVRGELCILAGWDDFSGFHLLADNDATAAFLERFAANHGHARTRS